MDETPELPTRSEETGSHLVSVVIPAFNAACYISEALASVAGQTYANWELDLTPWIRPFLMLGKAG